MSKDTKWTQGPWSHADGEIIASGVVIAQVMGADDFPCCEEDIDSECKANADLIKTAPDLYAALEAIVQKECPIVTHHRPDCEWCAGLRALAKARGEV